MVTLELMLLMLFTITLNFSESSICAESFNEFVDQVLQFNVSSRHKVNIVCETRLAERSTIDRERNAVVFDGFLYNSLQKRW